MRRFSVLLVLSLLVVAFMAMSATAAKAPNTSRVKNPLLVKQSEYSFPDENSFTRSTRIVADEQTSALGQVSSSMTSPGVSIGDTWYDYQHNGRMTRMVDWGTSAEEGFIVHFLWMYLPGPVMENREYMYNAYIANDGAFVDPIGVQPAGDYAGYVALDVTDDNRAVPSGHNNQGAGYQCQTYWDFSPGLAFFGTGSRVEDSTSAWATGQNPQVDSLKSVIWPAMVYQEVPGQTPVLHLFAQVSEPNAADPQAIVYFRKVGANETGKYDYPPFVVDTVFDIAQDVCASSTTGKVALVWIANRPDAGDCDTCSSQDGQQYVQWDNDIYYQISNDYGATFGNCVNMTMNVDGVDGYRPYTDLQSLIDSDDFLHIVWSGRFWPADANSGGQAGLFRCRMFHWGENLGTGGYDTFGKAMIRTAANLEWDQEICTPGSWNLQGSKMNISECDGKLYYLYVQYNDIPAGIENDCAHRGIDGSDIQGSANGDLYVVVSDDGGLTWDKARDITNSRTPDCDSATGVGGPCDSDNWPSMARFGTNQTGSFGFPSGVVIDPSGSYSGGYYLDIQYIHDNDPGGIVQDEGTWQMADVMWMRLACVEPIPVALLNTSFTAIDFPAWTKHGTWIDTPLVLENSGNTDLNGTFAVNETVGPVSGWLTSTFAGALTVPSGQNNTVSGTVTLNAGGAVNAPGTIVYLEGDLTITGNHEGSPTVIPISFWVADTLVTPEWDTITTGCLSLAVASNGNFGLQGEGGVNLDFFNYGDCDFVDPGVTDSVPGDASVYLFDGSPIICWMDETDTVRCNYSMFGEGYLSDHGYFPMGHVPPTDMGDYDLYQSSFVTRDTGIMLEKNWIAPHDGDTCEFMIEHLKIYVVDGATHAGLAIGEGMDWDIPSDSGSWNRSGFDNARKLIYQQGSEITDSLGDALECQQNDLRYGGMALLSVLENGTQNNTYYNAYTQDNSTQVYPLGFFANDSLWKYMGDNMGFSTSDSVDADLNMVWTFRWNYTLTPTDTLEVYKLFVTSKDGEADFLNKVDKGIAWACGNIIECGCCQLRADINHSGAGPDISDLVYLVTYMFSSGPEPPCMEEADINGSGTGPDISDLVYLVTYMFSSGPAPIPCN